MDVSIAFELPEGALGLLVAVCQQGTTVTISLEGELDLAQRPGLRKATNDVLGQSPECVILDLSCLDFIDSAGMHAVIELHRRSQQQHTRLVIFPGGPQVQRSFELTGLAEILPLFSGEVRDRTMLPRRAYTGMPAVDGCLSLTPIRLASRSCHSRRR